MPSVGRIGWHLQWMRLYVDADALAPLPPPADSPTHAARGYLRVPTLRLHTAVRVAWEPAVPIVDASTTSADEPVQAATLAQQFEAALSVRDLLVNGTMLFGFDGAALPRLATLRALSWRCAARLAVRRVALASLDSGCATTLAVPPRLPVWLVGRARSTGRSPPELADRAAPGLASAGGDEWWKTAFEDSLGAPLDLPPELLASLGGILRESLVNGNVNVLPPAAPRPARHLRGRIDAEAAAARRAAPPPPPPATASEWWDVALLLRIAHAVARPFVNVDAIIADVTANLTLWEGGAGHARLTGVRTSIDHGRLRLLQDDARAQTRCGRGCRSRRWAPARRCRWRRAAASPPRRRSDARAAGGGGGGARRPGCIVPGAAVAPGGGRRLLARGARVPQRDGGRPERQPQRARGVVDGGGGRARLARRAAD